MPEEPTPQDQNPTTETPELESTSQPTPQTPSPAAPPINSKYVEILEATLREQNARIQALADQVNRPAAPVETPKSPEEIRAEFYNDPITVQRKLIQEELQKAVAPLVEFTRGLRGDGTPYGNLKSRFKNDPRYKEMFNDPNFELAVDHVMSRSDLSEGAMQNTLINIAGLKAVGQLEAALIGQGIAPVRPSEVTPTPPPPPPVSTPPYVKPSAPPPVAPPGPPPRRELTENERRLARERGMSEDQYLDWLEVPASGVVSSRIGRTT
jgi:hypothetical protein